MIWSIKEYSYWNHCHAYSYQCHEPHRANDRRNNDDNTRDTNEETRVSLGRERTNSQGNIDKHERIRKNDNPNILTRFFDQFIRNTSLRKILNIQIWPIICIQIINKNLFTWQEFREIKCFIAERENRVFKHFFLPSLSNVRSKIVIVEQVRHNQCLRLSPAMIARQIIIRICLATARTNNCFSYKMKHKQICGYFYLI